MCVFSVFMSFYADIYMIVMTSLTSHHGCGSFNLVNAVFCVCSRKLSDWYD